MSTASSRSPLPLMSPRFALAVPMVVSACTRRSSSPPICSAIARTACARCNASRWSPRSPVSICWRADHARTRATPSDGCSPSTRASAARRCAGHLSVLAPVPVEACEERLGRCGARPVTARQKRVPRTFECCGRAFVADVEQRLGPLEEERRIVVARELQGAGVVGRRCGVCVEGSGPIAGLRARVSNVLFESRVGAAARPDELECGLPVVRQHLGVVVGASERLDPLGDGAVLRRALGARDLPVRDVPDEGMARTRTRSRSRSTFAARAGRSPFAPVHAAW